MKCAYCNTRFLIPIRGGTRRKFCNTTCRTNAWKLAAMERGEKLRKRGRNRDGHVT